MECNQTDIEKWKEMDTALDKPFNELSVWLHQMKKLPAYECLHKDLTRLITEAQLNISSAKAVIKCDVIKEVEFWATLQEAENVAM